MQKLDEIDKILANNDNNGFSKIYPFTTENINGYMSVFNLRGKSLLTVGSSCDQVINASLEGCEDITVCDICPLTKMFFYLKLASLLTLDREEFLDFLCKNKYQSNRAYNSHLLTKKLFNRIKSTLKFLDYDSYYIWEYLFGNYERKEIARLFRDDINSLDGIVYCNEYLMNDDNYNRAKEKIMNALVNFINGDVSSIKFDRKYDNIWLSNVAQYLKGNEIRVMVENAINFLTPNGKVLLCYFWNTSMTVKGFPISSFSRIDGKRVIIPGISENDSDNSILVYDNKKSLILK